MTASVPIGWPGAGEKSLLSAARPGSAARAGELIRAGGLVAFPTETVYGLGANATNSRAVARIFDAKGRPRLDPLIVHVASPEEARALWIVCPPEARRLMLMFWPGPLTLVLPTRKEVIPDIVTAGLPTVAVRVPDHPTALEMIRSAGRPVAAPSANLFGRPSPTTAQAVLEDLGEAVDLILDGGPTRIGLESTVVGFERGRPVILRPGAVSADSVRRVAGRLSLRGRAVGGPAAPGMLARHYAPRTPLYLLTRSHLHEGFRIGGFPNGNGVRMGSVIARGKAALLSFGPPPRDEGYGRVKVLSESWNLLEAAAGFFTALRELDASGMDVLVALPPPRWGLGLALRDRLERGSSGRAMSGREGLTLLERTKEEKDIRGFT